MYNPLYMTPHDDLHAAAAAADEPSTGPVATDHSFYIGGRAGVEDVQGSMAAAGAAGGAGTGISFAERFRKWSFEHERGMSSSGADLQNYNISPLLPVSQDHHHHHLLSHSASAGAGDGPSADVHREPNHGGHVNLLGTLGSSLGEGMNVGFPPLSNSSTQYPEAAGYASTTKPQYGTTQMDMEISRLNQAHNAASGSVHLSADIPSTLAHQSIGLSAASDYSIPYPHPTHRAFPSSTGYGANAHHNHDQLLADHRHHHHRHHQWDHSFGRTSSAGTHPHAELLLLPGIAESVVEASPPSTTHSAALSGSSKLDLLHVSSLHDKQDPMLPLGIAGGGGRLHSAAAQMWNVDKLDMTVGLGLHDNPVRSAIPIADIDQYATARSTQSGLSLFLPSPQQRGQTTLSLDAARYNTRSASGSLGVLRNSKYLKVAQQLLNEFCNVCKDGNADAKTSSTTATGSTSQSNMWNAAGRSGAEEMNMGEREDDHGQLSRAFFSNTAASVQKSSLYQLKSARGGAPTHDSQQEKTPTHSTPDYLPSTAPPKQLAADERCHLQMRKARLIAMVEELDRRYQQYRDQMQLIVTSFESATGMGGAAPYTTLAKRAMSRQFRNLRDAIGEHIRGVCRTLGEEVSSVPILSRGETPRLRLVDQRLRHQRSLQQIGMLPQQQAWRPQRGLPERSVSVLRAWLFEHFLHPYPKDSEKAMLARLTGLSRNQVSNWFINARVRLWKPMIEEMYLEESKALEMQQGEAAASASADGAATTASTDGGAAQYIGFRTGDANNNVNPQNGGGTGVTCMIQLTEESQQQQQECSLAPSRAGGWQEEAGHYVSSSIARHPGAASCVSDLNSFIHFHSSARASEPLSSMSHPDAEPPSHPFTWMKPQVPANPTAAAAAAAAQHAGDIGILTHTALHQQHHHHHQSNVHEAAALMQSHLSPAPSANFTKHGVSLTLGLQQPPPHSSYNSSNATHAAYHVRPPPSEALLF